MQVHLLASNIFGKKSNTKCAVTYIAMIIIWLNNIKTFAQNAENHVLRALMVKFSCAFSANNQATQLIRFRRLSAHCTIAAYKPIVNIATNFGRKFFESAPEFLSAPPHLSEVRCGPD